ncbi:MAG: 50S ribosomal protein L6 [Tenericutes bacterium ADurb.Bin087]|nr:MAG: 50S ribosomal protein L6 [Tenericutes bacterium ADurb.Bin087]
MSRIGLKVIKVPAGVEVKLEGDLITVKGPKGTNHVTLPRHITLDQSHVGEIHIKRDNELKQTKQSHGTTRALLNNAIVGVHDGFTIRLQIVGIGYRAIQDGHNVKLEVGYSHPTVIAPEAGAKITVENPNNVVVTGYNKQAVGQTAALIRGVRRPEPYKGKGIKYSDEVIIRKEGKRAGAKK